MNSPPTSQPTLDSKRPRVLMLGKGWFPAELGGLDRYYRGLLTAMPEASGIVVGPGWDAPSRVDVVSSHGSPLVDRLAKFVLAASRARQQADFVDVHFALYGLFPILLPRLRSQPLAVHFHGPWAEESRAAGEARSWRISIKRVVEQFVYQRADIAITLTEAFRQTLIETYGMDGVKVQVVGPAVDTVEFSPGDRASARVHLGIPDDAFLVCCVRRLVPRMGVDVLVDAWEETLATDNRAYLFVAGEGPLEEKLRRYVASQPWHARVRITGRLSEPDLLQLYRAADLNVLPSVAHEGFGLTVLEAAACGTPSVVTTVGGLPEAVSGLGDDLVVAAGSSEALGQRLRQARSGKLPSRLHARSWAIAHSWEATAERHRAIYAAHCIPR